MSPKSLMFFLPLMAYICAGFTEGAGEFYYNSYTKCLETRDSCFFSGGRMSNSSETNSTIQFCYSRNTILSTALPFISLSAGLTVIFILVIIFFNCNLASGPNHSCLLLPNCTFGLILCNISVLHCDAEPFHW